MTNCVDPASRALLRKEKKKEIKENTKQQRSRGWVCSEKFSMTKQLCKNHINVSIHTLPGVLELAR